MNHLMPEFTTEQVVERLRIQAVQTVSPYILDHMTIEQFADHFGDSIAYRFSSEVLAKTLSTKSVSQSVEFEHPATTWQMFKHGHRDGRWLGWIARRWPVRMERTTKTAIFEVKDRAAFPDCTMRFPKGLGHPMLFQTVEVDR